MGLGFSFLSFRCGDRLCLLGYILFYNTTLGTFFPLPVYSQINVNNFTSHGFTSLPNLNSKFNFITNKTNIIFPLKAEHESRDSFNSTKAPAEQKPTKSAQVHNKQTR